MEELHKWREMPELSVLVSPATGRWIALLMREMPGGAPRERCDLKCSAVADLPVRRYLSRGFRMPNWLGVRFEAQTEKALLLHLFDLAVEEEAETLEKYYCETPIPGLTEVPDRIQALYACDDFYASGKAMEDYEDDLTFTGRVPLYQPAYRDLTPQELRGYFTWRTALRAGTVQPHCDAFVSLYCSELMLGIGVSSPTDALNKMDAFAAQYFAAGFGSGALQRNFKNWRFEYAVLSQIEPARTQGYENPALRRWDHAVMALRAAEAESDAALFAALAELGGKKLTASQSVKALGARAESYYASVWRACGEVLFSACFGSMTARNWKPFADIPRLARVRERAGRDFTYQLSAVRHFSATGSEFTEYGYARRRFDSRLFFIFLAEVDRQLRISCLKRNIRTASGADEALQLAIARALASCDARAATAEVPLARERLADIRAAASFTEAALLTPAELEAAQEEAERTSAAAQAPQVTPGDGDEGAVCGSVASGTESPAARGERPAEELAVLDALELRCLAALLRGEPVRDMLRAAHVLPSLFAEHVNEKLFSHFQDICVEAEGEKLSLLEDYREELEHFLEGADHV